MDRVIQYVEVNALVASLTYTTEAERRVEGENFF